MEDRTNVLKKSITAYVLIDGRHIAELSLSEYEDNTLITTRIFASWHTPEDIRLIVTETLLALDAACLRAVDGENTLLFTQHPSITQERF